MAMAGSISLGGATEDSIPSTNERDDDKVSTTTIPRARQATSPIQNARSWQGGPPGWTPGSGDHSWPWGGNPTTILTFTTTVAYTQSSSALGASQSSSPSQMASGGREGGVDISGPVAAGIGAGASIGLLGIGIVVYLCMKYSRRRRRRHQSSKEQESDHVEVTGVNVRPPYQFSASNESPVELSATRQPQEMCAEPQPQEKDSLNRLVSAGLERELPIIRKGNYIESWDGH